MSDALGGLFQRFINYLYSKGDISVPADFPSQCAKIKQMMGNDVTGIVSTITNYSINSASEAKLKVECSDSTTEELFNLWLSMININLNGVPTGLQELAKEYYKERWQGSSLCLLKVSNWQTITINKTSIKVPTVLWYVNGASITIERKKEKYVKLGTDKYYYDEQKKIPVIEDIRKEQLFVQKPFSRWISQYPTPYLVLNGVLKNFLGVEVLSSKVDEVISKVLPYLFIIEKGDKDAFIQKDVDYSDPELKKLVNGLKDYLSRYQQEKSNVPLTAVPFDQQYKHLIPDLTKILSAELYTQGYRAILSGLGFVSVVQGIGDTRKEEVLNPKPFIAEVNAGVRDFKSMLMDVIKVIIKTNKIEHRKLFSEKKSLEITNSPLKINVESILDAIRSGFVYGAIGYTTYQEILGINPEQELERAKKEWNEGYRQLFYPHAIQNQEDKGIDTVLPTTKKEIEKTVENEKKQNHTQKGTVLNEPIDPNLKPIIVKCPKCSNKFDYLSVSEAGMGYVKCPKCQEAVTQKDMVVAPFDKNNPPDFLKKYPEGAINTFIEVFNENLPKGEDYAYPVAWTALKRWMKKHGYKKVNDKWVKEEK